MKNMKSLKLNSAEARNVMPTECAILAEQGKLVMGAIQMPMPEPDCWPSGSDLEREAQAAFGVARIAECEPYDDNETVTWLVVGE